MANFGDLSPDNTIVGGTTGATIGNIRDALKVIIGDRDDNYVAVSNFSEMITTTRTVSVEAKFYYNINTLTLLNLSANGGTVTQANRAALLSTSTATNGLGYIRTVAAVDYRVSQTLEASTSFVFSSVTGTVGSQVGVAGCRMLLGVFSSADGLYWGFDGNQTFSVFYKRDNVETKINQSNFSIDKLDGTTVTDGIVSQYKPDWTKLQLIRVNYSWHGVAPFLYQIKTPAGNWITFHKVSVLNTTALSNLGTPSLPLAALIQKTSGATNVSMIWQAGQISYIGSGETPSSGRKFSSRADKTISSTLVPVLSIRSKTAYAGLANFISSKIDWFSVASSGNKTVTFVAIFQATLTGAVWSDVNTTNSVMEFDTSATSFTGGIEVIPISIGASDSFAGVVKDIEGTMYPGQVLTLAAISALSNDVRVGVNWEELH
jgi:hypothetical protein